MLAVNADHLGHAEQRPKLDVDADLLSDLAARRCFGPFEEIDFAARQVPMTGLGRRTPLNQENAILSQDSGPAADARPLTQEAIAARMRVQERAPLRKDESSYFSFGEWTASSSSPKPTSSASMLRSRLKTPTIGMEPPDPTSTGGLPHSFSRARRARRSASLLVDTTIAGLDAWPTYSALTSTGKRALTKLRKLWEILSGLWRPTRRNDTLALASAGNTVLDPAPV